MISVVYFVKKIGIKLSKYIYFQIAREADLLFTMGWEPVKHLGHDLILKQSALVDNLNLFKICVKKGAKINTLLLEDYCANARKILVFICGIEDLDWLKRELLHAAICKLGHKEAYDKAVEHRVFHNLRIDTYCCAVANKQMEFLDYVYKNYHLSFKKEVILSAIRTGDIEIFKQIIEYFPNKTVENTKHVIINKLMNKDEQFGKIVIDKACKSGNIELLRIISKTGKIKSVHTTSAFKGGNLDIIRMLEDKTLYVESFLSACKSNNILVLEYLLKHCDKIQFAQACQYEIPDIINYLITKVTPVDIDLGLIEASKNNNPQVVKILLQHGAKTANKALKKIKFFSKKAIENIELLLKHGKADINNINIDICVCYEIIMLAIKYGHKNLIEILYINIMDEEENLSCILLRQGAEYSQAIFNLACELNMRKAVKLMNKNINLQEGFVKACKNECFDVIDYFVGIKLAGIHEILNTFVCLGHVEIIKVFVNHGYDNGYGIIWAAHTGNLELVKKYVAQGSQYLQQSLKFALQEPEKTEVAKYLVANGAFFIATKKRRMGAINSVTFGNLFI